jgi:hypothetical protein
MLMQLFCIWRCVVIDSFVYTGKEFIDKFCQTGRVKWLYGISNPTLRMAFPAIMNDIDAVVAKGQLPDALVPPKIACAFFFITEMACMAVQECDRDGLEQLRPQSPPPPYSSVTKAPRAHPPNNAGTKRRKIDDDDDDDLKMIVPYEDEVTPMC